MGKSNLILYCICVMILSVGLVACGSNDTVDTSENENNNAGENTDKATGESNEQSFQLGYVVNREDKGPYTVAAETFAESLTEKTNGDIQIELFPGGQLGGDRDMFEAISMGVLDIGVISSPVVAGFTPVLGGADMPWLYDNDYDLLYEVQTGEIGRNALDALERETGVKALSFTFQPFRHFFSRNPIEGIDDFNGLLLRSMESSIHIDGWNAIGASPQAIPYTEVYTAMQTNVIDAFESDVIGAVTSKFYEVSDYVTISGHFNNSVLLLMSEKAWNSLSSEQQQAAEESAKVAAKASMDITKEVESEYMERLDEEGVIINEIDIAPLKEKVQKVYDKYSDTPEVKEFIEAVQKLK